MSELPSRSSVFENLLSCGRAPFWGWTDGFNAVKHMWLPNVVAALKICGDTLQHLLLPRHASSSHNEIYNWILYLNLYLSSQIWRTNRETVTLSTSPSSLCRREVVRILAEQATFAQSGYLTTSLRFSAATLCILEKNHQDDQAAEGQPLLLISQSCIARDIYCYILPKSSVYRSEVVGILAEKGGLN